MWQILAKLLTGPIISGAIDAYKAKLAAGNTADNIAAGLAEKELLIEQRERELNLQIIQAEEGRWWTALPRALVCYTFAIYVMKAVVWDKVLGWGSTPALGGDLAQAFNWLMAVWFGGRSFEKIARIIKR